MEKMGFMKSTFLSYRKCRVLLFIFFLVGLTVLFSHDLNGTDLFPHWKDYQSVESIFERGPEGRRLEFGLPAGSVAVVDEHYEVLIYWMDAAESGVIPKSGNTLVHFDAHIDFAAPIKRFTKYFPLYRWPRTQKEKMELLQVNDNFIVLAISIGLFDRFIWVLPDWALDDDDQDRRNSDNGFLAKGTVEVGLAQIHGEFSDYLAFCCCETDVVSGRKVPQCSYDIRDSENETVAISRADCHVKMTIQYEHMTVSKARKLIQTEHWLTNSNVILDVDEDFWGCESAMKTLRPVKISEEFVSSLDDLITSTFCLSRTKDENNLNLFFKTVISILEETTTLPLAGRKIKVRRRINQLWKNAVEKRFLLTSDMFCEGDSFDIDINLNRILLRLMRLNRNQLRAIGRIGICLQSSKSSVLSRESKCTICHGVNMPDVSVVSFHSPSYDEIDKISKKVAEFLLHPNFPATNFIGLCRSVRDGYTPRSKTGSIEKRLLAIFAQMPFKSNNLSRMVHYDENLLGGVAGWSNFSTLRPLSLSDS